MTSCSTVHTSPHLVLGPQRATQEPQAWVPSHLPWLEQSLLLPVLCPAAGAASASRNTEKESPFPFLFLFLLYLVFIPLILPLYSIRSIITPSSHILASVHFFYTLSSYDLLETPYIHSSFWLLQFDFLNLGLLHC